MAFSALSKKTQFPGVRGITSLILLRDYPHFPGLALRLSFLTAFGLAIRLGGDSIHPGDFKETDYQKQGLELLKERSEVLNEWRWMEYRAALGEEEEAIATLVAWRSDEDWFVQSTAAEVDRHQDSEYLGNAINALWDLVAPEQN